MPYIPEEIEDYAERFCSDQLASIAPDIRVADYQIAALGLSPTIFSNENSRTDTDSSRRRA